MYGMFRTEDVPITMSTFNLLLSLGLSILHLLTIRHSWSEIARRIPSRCILKVDLISPIAPAVAWGGRRPYPHVISRTAIP